jgi:predicted nuclease with TOPRIM domain
MKKALSLTLVLLMCLSAVFATPAVSADTTYNTSNAIRIEWLTMEEDDFAAVVNQPVVKGLIKNNAIMVLDKEPAELKNSLPNLQVTNNTLKAENETLKAEKAVLEARIKELEVGTTGIDLEAEIAKAVDAVKAEYEQKLKELDDKATGIITEKDATIATLEQDIKKLEKKLKKTEE